MLSWVDEKEVELQAGFQPNSEVLLQESHIESDLSHAM